MTEECSELTYGNGAPRRIRTSGLLIRSQSLYPTELWAHNRWDSLRIARGVDEIKRAETLALRSFQTSVDVEIDFDGDLYGDGVTLVHGGFELVLTHGFDGFFVEAHAELADDADALRHAVRVHDERDY
jgi:hypothetical protein